MTAPNDAFDYAALLPTATAGVSIGELNFHDGDRGDWYVLTAQALNRFGELDRALLTREQIAIEFEAGDQQALFDHAEYTGRTHFLFRWSERCEQRRAD